jgi:hypothetical protein
MKQQTGKATTPMALSSVKPEGLPSTNALDNIPSLPPTRREIRLGQNTLLALDNPPVLSETIDVVLRLRVVRRGDEQLAPGSDIVYYCATKIVTAWQLGQPVPPEPPDICGEQPAMVDGDGNVIDNPDDDGSW